MLPFAAKVCVRFCDSVVTELSEFLVEKEFAYSVYTYPSLFPIIKSSIIRSYSVFVKKGSNEFSLLPFLFIVFALRGYVCIYGW